MITSSILSSVYLVRYGDCKAEFMVVYFLCREHALYVVVIKNSFCNLLLFMVMRSIPSSVYLVR